MFKKASVVLSLFSVINLNAMYTIKSFTETHFTTAKEKATCVLALKEMGYTPTSRINPNLKAVYRTMHQIRTSQKAETKAGIELSRRLNNKK